MGGFTRSDIKAQISERADAAEAMSDQGQSSARTMWPIWAGVALLLTLYFGCTGFIVGALDKAGLLGERFIWVFWPPIQISKKIKSLDYMYQWQYEMIIPAP